MSTCSSLRSSRAKDEAIRRDAMRWRDDDQYCLSSRPTPRTRKPLRATRREQKPAPVWDEFGYLTNTFEQEYFSRTRPARDTNSLIMGRSQGIAKVQPKRRANSVTRANQKRAMERLSAMRKAPEPKPERKRVETDFDGFIERQDQSQQARMNASKNQKKFGKPAMSDGTKSIIKKARLRSQLMQFPPQPEVNNTPERPSKSLNETSGRLANMDVSLELNMLEVKKAVLRDEIMRESGEYGSGRPKSSRRSSCMSPRAWHPKMTHRTADERRKIEEKALELRPIVSQTEKEHWVKPEYGKKPDYIEVILDTLGIDEERRKSQRRRRRS